MCHRFAIRLTLAVACAILAPAPRTSSAAPRPSSIFLEHSLIQLTQAGPKIVTAQTTNACDFSVEIALAEAASRSREAAQAAAARPHTATVDRILAGATKANVPVASQISGDTARDFGVARQALLAIEARQLIERRRQRDLRVVNRLIAMAMVAWKFRMEPGQGHPDSKLQTLLTALVEADKTEDFELLPRAQACTIDAALYDLQLEALAYLSTLQLDASIALRRSLEGKYGFTGGIDAARLDEADRESWLLAQLTVIEPAASTKEYLLRLNAVRRLVAASEIAFEFDAKDAEKLGSSVSTIGAGLADAIAAGRIDKALLNALGAWRFANESDATP